MPEIKVGDRAPSFSLLDQEGKSFRLDDELGRGPLVLFFYPKDETPICTKEACSFRDANADFVAAGATVVGISSDSVESHRRFASKHKLDYRLLADEGGQVRKLFGAPRALFGLQDGRVTYVLDRTGVVRHRHSAMLQAQKHVDTAMALVKSLR